MVNLKEIVDQTFKELETFNVETILPDLKDCAQGSINDVLDTQDSLYYQWITCLMRTYKPKQIVELGGAMGCSALCMLSQLPEEAKLYSITLPEHGLEFSYIKTQYPQLTKIVGDDKDMSVWPKDLDFAKTDLLFIDAEHTAEAVRRELKTYLPLIGKGKLVLVDDIHMDELWDVWLELDKEKMDLSILHHSGYGAFIS
jgi:predicted O-methyltransferase YrrM